MTPLGKRPMLVHSRACSVTSFGEWRGKRETSPGAALATGDTSFELTHSGVADCEVHLAFDNFLNHLCFTRRKAVQNVFRRTVVFPLLILEGSK